MPLQSHMAFHIGISGWNYDGWRGEFYPEGLPQRRELEYAGRFLNSIEINGTFYSLQSVRSFRKWRDQTPSRNFVFAVKGSRYITHTLRLREPREALANFFASGVLALEAKLGPFLWQLPPNMAFEPDTVKRFCDLLPSDFNAAAKLAGDHHTGQVKEPFYGVESNHNLRHAFEVRDERFMDERFIRILHEHGCALVFADTAGKHPYAEDITAGFIYIRLHGSRELYASGYGEKELSWWKRRIDRWSKGGEMKTGRRISDRKPPARKSRDVYVYFDNDVKVHAPFDALSLAEKLGVASDPYHLQDAGGDPMPPPPRLAK